MKQHQYRLTVEHLTDAQGELSGHAPLQFEVGNHDDIIAIVERLRNRSDFGEDEAAAFGVGLKLLGEVIITNKENPLFDTLRVPFAQFMKVLKTSSKQSIAGLPEHTNRP
ncbi:MAG: DUF3861 domain-containing protein [Burkholderiales bacterium]|nr:DUF3861 domain-containing protein [Burkholderiales bacterium]